jgi:hypothetical protein
VRISLRLSLVRGVGRAVVGGTADEPLHRRGERAHGSKHLFDIFVTERFMCREGRPGVPRGPLGPHRKAIRPVGGAKGAKGRKGVRKGSGEGPRKPRNAAPPGGSPREASASAVSRA